MVYVRLCSLMGLSLMEYTDHHAILDQSVFGQEVQNIAYSLVEQMNWCHIYTSLFKNNVPSLVGLMAARYGVYWK